MVNSPQSDLNQSLKIVSNDHDKRKHREISSVQSRIDVSNSHMALQILVVITPLMNDQD